MRRLAILALLLTTAVSAYAASYEARSPRHLVTIEPVSLPSGQTRYDLTITDVATGKVLGTPSMIGRRVLLAHEPIDVAGLHITLQLGDDGTSLTVNIGFEQSDTVIDEIRANWMLKPRRARLHASCAVRVGGEVKAPKVLKKVDPVYPEDARLARVSGIVIVEVVIDRTGHVVDGVVLKPLPFGLSESALDAVKQWIFEPGTVKGSPVDVIFTLTVNFKLDPAPPAEN
jgi:TonB family protein